MGWVTGVLGADDGAKNGCRNHTSHPANRLKKQGISRGYAGGDSAATSPSPGAELSAPVVSTPVNDFTPPGGDLPADKSSGKVRLGGSTGGRPDAK
jgi:hypothetical protein